MKLRRAGLVGVVVTTGLATATIAVAHDGASSDDGAIDNAKITHHHHDHQHGGDEGHLPAVQNDVEVVSQLELRNVEPGKIADVGVHEGFAYLAAWGGETCRYNGVHVVDIRDPAAPQEVAFIKAKEGSAPGEGIQAIELTTPMFNGDILVSNNETCNENTGFGGLNIYDVTNAAHPTPLTEGFGDETTPGQGKKAAHEIHSIFAWDAGDKGYAVIVDNEEGPDVDIVDITNPKKPVLIAEYDLDETFPQIVQETPANLVQIFHHDVVVKEIDGRWIMLVSYWDGGYVTLDVTAPTNATYVGDSDFANPDPELLLQSGLTEAPEGNAHQSEFTMDNQYILAADEDFNPTGLEATSDDGGAFNAIPGDATEPIPVGDTLTGTTTYVGRACIGDAAVPAGDPAITDIAVVVRGLCTFTEKVANVIAAGGWDAVLVVNREGADACGPLAMAVEGDIPAFSVERSVGYDLFDLPGFDFDACLAGTAEQLPGVEIGDAGDVVSLRSFFDGWGYIHLFANEDGKFTELDTFAIPEAMDPDFAEGFGDLSVHEIAVSHDEADLAYSSYYAGGLRVFRIVDEQIVEVGSYIDPEGNNFWGVQVFHDADGRELVAASDRDHGLWIFDYTGTD